MSSVVVPENERERLFALRECDILDTPPEPLFDSLTRLAAEVCQAPVALVSLIDSQRQWFKSNHGLFDVRQTSREIAFCAHTILGEQLLEVPDALRDIRFLNNPLVTHEPKVRFYAGMPLRDARGFALGAVCVMDYQPRRLTHAQREGLENLARLATALLEQRRVERRLRDSEERLQAVARATAEAEQQALLRERRQKLIADLGQRALADPDADALMENAVRLVSEALGFEYCRVLELAQGGLTLLSRATVGTVPVLNDTGSRVAALISGPQGPYGLLEVRSGVSGKVSPDVTHFVQNVANIVGTALARRRADEQLAYAAQFDILTGLPNRQLFRDRIAQSIARAMRKTRPIAVVVLNLDGFKLVNNSHGHAAGDRVLIQVAERLISCVSAYDTVSRLGADEFAIVLSNIDRIEEVAPVVQRALHTLAQPFDLDDDEAFISATAGVSIFDSDGVDAHTLIKNAELAMQRAREKGRNFYEFFAPEMNQRGLERMRLERGLRRALERGEFLLHYQPKISAATGKMSGAEALLRWQHPERGLVYPSEFIPILEETGLIVPVGLWVLETACEQVRRWEREGIDVESIGINLSARQFQQPHFDAHMRRVIETSGIKPGKIELEITESMLMNDPAQAIETLGRLKQLGVSVSVDDFGTGYSGLSYLRQLPLDSLKIARNFISNVPHDPDDVAIALAIINLAHNLGLKVVAEGVETEAQARFLAAHRCDFLQGYFFSVPLDTERYARLEVSGDVPRISPVSSDSGRVVPFPK
jgi:diguanylate cyclase (GGDEF)-like protein